MPRIPSGIVRTLLESFNPFGHRSTQFCWVLTLQNEIEPFRRGSNPFLTVQIPNRKGFDPSKTGSKRGFEAGKHFEDGFQVIGIAFGGFEDGKRRSKTGFERSGDGFEPFQKGSNPFRKGLNSSQKGLNTSRKGSNDPWTGSRPSKEGLNSSKKGSKASEEGSNDARKGSNDFGDSSNDSHRRCAAHSRQPKPTHLSS